MNPILITILLTLLQLLYFDSSSAIKCYSCAESLISEGSDFFGKNCIEGGIPLPDNKDGSPPIEQDCAEAGPVEDKGQCLIQFTHKPNSTSQPIPEVYKRCIGVYDEAILKCLRKSITIKGNCVVAQSFEEYDKKHSLCENKLEVKDARRKRRRRRREADQGGFHGTGNSQMWVALCWCTGDKCNDDKAMDIVNTWKTGDVTRDKGETSTPSGSGTKAGIQFLVYSLLAFKAIGA